MSLFGNPSASSRPSLFSSSGQTNAQTQSSNGGLFGNASNNPQQQPVAQNPFSSLSAPSSQQQPASGSSLFGSTTQAQSTNLGLFGNTLSQPQNTGTSLFGNVSTANQQPSNSTNDLFGGPQTQQASTSNPLAAASNPGTTSLFSQSAQQPQQAQPSNSLFGASTSPAQHQQQSQQAPSLLGVQNTQQQGPFASSSLSSSLRRSIAPVWQPGSSVGMRERSIPDQMQVLLEKWSPESPTCSFQAYTHDQAPEGMLTFFGPEPREDPQKWEDAYQKRPFPGAVPHLIKGFAELGIRLRMQVQAVARLQQRIHEINSSLDTILSQHDLEVSVKISEAKRKHIALSQRCLRLATKVQVLRNRGYNLDGPEEELKTRLKELERHAFDPALAGRCEEVWARMVGISERLRFLQQETERIGASDGSRKDGGVLSAEVLKRTMMILSDHESQISTARKELEQARKDFETATAGAR